jgi:hypothetical protein
MALLSEDREKASEARQFTKFAKNPFGQNNFSFLRHRIRIISSRNKLP